MEDGDVADIAFARAWSVYLLINRRVDKNDERRASLLRFIQQRCGAGERDVESLVVESLRHLKKLDASGASSLE